MSRIPCLEIKRPVFAALVPNEQLAMRPILSNLYQLYHRSGQNVLSSCPDQSDQDHSHLSDHFLTDSTQPILTVHITRAK
jgi:hypothetical protein